MKIRTPGISYRADAKKQAVEAGINRYLASFATPPPETRDELEAAIQWSSPEVQNPIAEALQHADYALFRAEVLARMNR